MSRRWPRMIVALAAFIILMPGAGSTVARSDGRESDVGSTGFGAALEALLARVPESQRDYCGPNFVREEDAEGVVMSVRCELPSGIQVQYTQLDTPEALADRYQRIRESMGIAESTGDCSEALPGEEPYTIDGQPAGRLMCYRSYGDKFDWTDDAANIYGEARKSDDLSGLWEWWISESGPIDPALDSPETGLGAALDALLLQVPESYRATCRPSSGGRRDLGFVVSLACEVSPRLQVYYDQLDSPEALAAAYRRDLKKDEIAESTGDCSETVPGEEPYSIGGEPAGRLLCLGFTGSDSVMFTWTHEPTLIKATAFLTGDLADLWEWWLNESGPIG